MMWNDCPCMQWRYRQCWWQVKGHSGAWVDSSFPHIRGEFRCGQEAGSVQQHPQCLKFMLLVED
jgi:hypothetical protein